MKILNLFKKQISNEEKKLNKLWEEWTKGCVDSPYKELMTYQSEVNNGGHRQYFFNTAEISDLKKELTILDSILPEKMKSNVHRAYEVYLRLEINEDDEKAEYMLEQCDQLFYDDQDDINQILIKYISK